MSPKTGPLELVHHEPIKLAIEKMLGQPVKTLYKDIVKAQFLAEMVDGTMQNVTYEAVADFAEPKPDTPPWVQAQIKHYTMGVKLPTHIGPMVLAAKYPGTCQVCDLKFPRGVPITWEKGDGARHMGCYLRARSDKLEAGESKNKMRTAADDADVILSTLLGISDEGRDLLDDPEVAELLHSL